MSSATRLPVAVLDTSVLVPRWPRLTLQALAARPDPPFRAVWSEWIIAETWRILADHLARAEVPSNIIAARADQMMHHLLQAMSLVSVSRIPLTALDPPSSDPNDALVWATAVVSKADYVVSHNIRHFPPLVREQTEIAGRRVVTERHLHKGVEFLTAIEFIEDVLGEDAAATYGQPLPAGGVIRSQRSTRVL